MSALLTISPQAASKRSEDGNPQPATSRAAAALILEKWQRAMAGRDRTLAAASEACRDALDCGDLLLDQRERHKGNFDLWLKGYCPQIAESTAKDFMRIARMRRAVGDGEIDSQMVWQFYHALDILPPRAATERNPKGQILQFWVYTDKLEHWLPNLPENQKPRLRSWWEKLGRAQGWL